MVNNWEEPDFVLSGYCLCNIPKPSYSGVCTKCKRTVALTENWAGTSNSTEIKTVSEKSNGEKNSNSLENKYCAECSLTYKSSSSFCSNCGTKLTSQSTLEKIYCENCGKPIRKNGKKCLSCGSKVEVNLESIDKEIDTFNPNDTWTAEKYRPSSEKKPGNSVILWLIVISVIAVIFFISGKANSNNSNSGSEVSNSSAGHYVKKCWNVKNPNYDSSPTSINESLHGPSPWIEQCQMIWVSN